MSAVAGKAIRSGGNASGTVVVACSTCGTVEVEARIACGAVRGGDVAGETVSVAR